MRFGIYRLEGIGDEASLQAVERELGVPIAIRSYYRAWNRCRIEDDRAWFASLAASRRDVLLTWEPWQIPPASPCPEDQPDFSLRQILSGRYDCYVRDVARTLASLPVTIYLRPLHEMNGNWYPWCGCVNGNSSREFVLVWHHLRTLFKDAGAANIVWVWSPYIFSYPGSAENAMECYFPGADALDVIGLDGYNWGSEPQWGTWRSFTELFADAYRRVTALCSNKIMICETASAVTGGDKAAWIADMLDRLASDYGRVEAVIWFDIDKECDWRIASSEATLELFRNRAGLIFPEIGIGQVAQREEIEMKGPPERM